MDEETKKAIDSVNAQIQILASLFTDLQKRLDAVQDLAVTVSAFARVSHEILQTHLAAFAAETHAPSPAPKPRPGPEVG